MVEIGDFEFYGDEGAEDRVRELIEQRDDLLKALQAFVDVYGIDDVKRWMNVRDNARVAISKALRGFTSPTNGN